MDPLIFWGLLVGFAFGFALSRGRFCMNSAFRDIIVLKDYTILKAVGVAILVSMIGFTIMDKGGVITLNPKPFVWGANMVGGFIFGIGMVLGGGCASGISYRAGEGMVGAMAAVLGLTLAGTMTAMGAFKPAAAFLQGSTKVTLADGANLTLANVFGISHHVLAFSIAAIAIIIWAVFAIRGKKAKKEETASLGERIFKKGWGWTSTGVVIGIIAMIAFYSSAATGRGYPLGITAGWIGILKSLIMGQNFLGWVSMMIIGLVVGAFVAALVAGEFKLRAPAPGVLIQCFFGGLLMGFGAVTAMGCNITHILSGVPQLALSSLLTGAFIIFGCWTLAYFMFVRPMRNL